MNRSHLLLGILGLMGSTLLTVQAGASSSDWKLAVQAWTFNHTTLIDTAEKASALGIKYIEAYPGQALGGGLAGNIGPDMDAGAKAGLLAKLKSLDIRLVNFGVTGAGDEAGWRKLFEFAKSVGIETICAEPAENQFALLDTLCNQYKINIAIHNHPKPSHYWNPDTVLAACKGHSKRIGACADTGHWVRSGLDPVECLQKLQGRIITLHFKDLNVKGPEAHDVPWGTGISKAPAMFTELKRQHFRGVFSIEYEHKTPQLLENVQKCAAFFTTAAGMSEKDLLAGKLVRPGFSPQPQDVWKDVKVRPDNKWPQTP